SVRNFYVSPKLTSTVRLTLSQSRVIGRRANECVHKLWKIVPISHKQLLIHAVFN
ncbi:hypothetical protein L9F63_020292, partial [Diploptera punctata]